MELVSSRTIIRSNIMHVHTINNNNNRSKNRQSSKLENTNLIAIHTPIVISINFKKLILQLQPFMFCQVLLFYVASGLSLLPYRV